MTAVEKVMSYDNPWVVQRLKEKLDISVEEAEELFDDTKRFLYLATVTEEPISPPQKIDEGWHEFLLFTRDYQQFCRERIGFFVHHVPNVPGTEQEETVSARDVALSVFGDNLSENWLSQEADCDECTPETNCESAPSDCGINHCHS